MFGIIKCHFNIWIWLKNVRICTIKSRYNSVSSLLYQDTWHYGYVKIRMCLTMSGYGSIMSDYGILLLEYGRGISLGHGIM